MIHADDFGAFVPGPRAILPPTGSGSLDGLTFAVKDLIDVAGVRTGGGNPDWLASQAIAANSAPVVRALLSAGATLRGKTITDELAFSLEGANAHYGTPINPACPDRIPGGSSSGSAVAVAAGLVDVALGTDTGGSVRVPASFTGVFGFRPSHDAVSLDGVIPFASSYDTIGWFARDADRLARVGAILLPASPPSPIKTFVIARDAFALADDDVARLLLEQCSRLGVAEEITLFDGQESEWLECYRVLQGAEIWQSLGPWIEATRPAFGKSIAPRFADAATITAADVTCHRDTRAAIAARLDAVVSSDVALVMPTAPCIAPRRNESGFDAADFYRRALVLTSVAGHSGAPQVSLPAGHVDGCPVGLSILAGHGYDHALLAVARRWTEGGLSTATR